MSYTREDWSFSRAIDEFFKQMAPIDVRSEPLEYRSPVAARAASPVRLASPPRRAVRFISPAERSRSPIRGPLVQPIQVQRGRVRRQDQDEKCDPNPPRIIQSYRERLSSYMSIRDYLDSVVNTGDICALRENIFPCKKQIGSKSESGIIYRLYNRRILRQTRSAMAGRGGVLPTDFIVKVMKNIKSNILEVEHTTEFRDLVLKNKIPNFVLSWKDYNCLDKCSFIDPASMEQGYRRAWEEIKAGSCYLFFAELFHGDMNDFQNYLEPFTREEKARILISFIVQIFIASSIFDRYKIAHDDLHSGNVLFKRYSDDPDSSFVYELKGMKISLRHQSHLFAIWDIANLKKRWAGSSVKNEMAGIFRDLSNLFSWISVYFNDMIDDEDTGIPYRNANPDPDFYKLFEELSDFCYSKHDDKKSLNINNILSIDLPELMDRFLLLDTWREVVRINAPIEEQSTTQIFKLSDVL